MLLHTNSTWFLPRNPFLKFKIQYLHSIKKWSIELTPFLFCQSHTSINNENAEFNFSKFPLASLSNTSAHYLKKNQKIFLVRICANLPCPSTIAVDLRTIHFHPHSWFFGQHFCFLWKTIGSRKRNLVHVIAMYCLNLLATQKCYLFKN